MLYVFHPLDSIIGVVENSSQCEYDSGWGDLKSVAASISTHTHTHIKSNAHTRDNIEIIHMQF